MAMTEAYARALVAVHARQLRETIEEVEGVLMRWRPDNDYTATMVIHNEARAILRKFREDKELTK